MTDEVQTSNESPEPARENSLNIPNLITFSRLVLSFVVLALIDFTDYWLLTTAIFVIAAATDFLDGYLARKWNQVTVLGRIMDPFVDKVIVGGTLIFLTAHPDSGICPWTTFIVIGREMFVTGLRSVLEGHGIDFSAKWSGKLKMIVQSVTIPLCLASMSPTLTQFLGPYAEHFVSFRDWMIIAMVLITLYSGAEYTWRGMALMSQQKSTPEK
ncbi:CDP-diacylglycerol--glycerol-3-phosphate 3-phosphatidyltransferase [Thalassoglobus neptunius]|uniref:CDP-diacylglycerol--glycerol-3-phosphate 3-phosphatidyltransferase n=1 Tax=Thalassoglobus neptunius TaxID=1938619 RepID=A0A5C5WNG4_9PLAN|nr:CDP-diacylglycerol--glycerol-3-phosphate 3-phosphatidyltransferase [Thalassoglobus neptunius]TWT51553.1 CDP-diacylglycerol--glycerol-3-phosphate 3-phosphatidyltransferase [Thalassoglobus neptunius]